MPDYAKNFVYGVVTTAPSPASSGTTIKMSDADAAVFPDPATAGVGAYDVTVWPAGTKPLAANAEIVRITAKGASSGGETVFTITRQQQSTSARTIVVGDQISMTITAKTVTDIIGMGTASMVRGEIPGGSVNSSNTAFTTASRFQPGALRVYQNGIRLKGGGEDFTEGTQAFTMTVAPVTGDILLVDYETNTTAFMQGSSSFVYDETPSGTVNGSNVTFTLANTPVAGTLVLYRDGQRLVPGGADYTLSTATITFVTAPATGSILRADYQLFASVAGNADTLDGLHASTNAETNGQLVANYGGWIVINDTLSYSSADAPTFVIGTTKDLTGVIGVGMRIKLTQTTAKYFIVTAITSSTITIYGGTDYTLANEAITLPFFSYQKAPLGFPLDSIKWTVSFTDTSTRTQNTPSNGTTYNIGNSLLSIPIGAWNLSYEVTVYNTNTVAKTGIDQQVGLSTANNSLTILELVCYTYMLGLTHNNHMINYTRSAKLLLSAKQTWYLNYFPGSNAPDTVSYYGVACTTKIIATCSYL